MSSSRKIPTWTYFVRIGQLATRPSGLTFITTQTSSVFRQSQCKPYQPLLRPPLRKPSNISIAMGLGIWEEGWCIYTWALQTQSMSVGKWGEGRGTKVHLKTNHRRVIHVLSRARVLQTQDFHTVLRSKNRSVDSHQKWPNWYCLSFCSVFKKKKIYIPWPSKWSKFD